MNKQDTNFLRFIAICLILNSHMDLYYPIPHIGTGGSIGNALFFMLSAFGLLLSEKRAPQTFSVYYTKRIKRIYPAVWVVLVLLIIPIKLVQNPTELSNILSFASRFFYPPFWFLKALMLFFLIGFVFIKNFSLKKIVTFWAVCLFLYVFIYTNYLDIDAFVVEKLPFRLLFYVMMFVFGIFLASINSKIKFAGFRDVIILLFTIGVIYSHKFLMARNLFLDLQALQHLFLFVFVFYALKISRAEMVRVRIMALPVIGTIITFISRITLEIYIVHVTISPIILRLKLPFPLNAVVFLVLAISISAMANWISKKGMKFSIGYSHG